PDSEAPDRYEGTVQGRRTEDGIQAAPIGQPRVDHGRLLAELTPRFFQEPTNDLQEVRLVSERRVDSLELALSFDEYLVWAVDQYFGNINRAQECAERTEPEQLVHHLIDDGFLVVKIQGAGLQISEFGGQTLKFLAQFQLTDTSNLVWR